MLRSKLAAFRRPLALLGLGALAAMPVMTPFKAQAYWYHGYWRPGVVVVAPPVVVGPPAVVVRAPYPRYWVPGHFWRGYWIRGHWA